MLKPVPPERISCAFGYRDHTHCLVIMCESLSLESFNYLCKLLQGILTFMGNGKHQSNDRLTAYLRDIMKAKGVTQADMAIASNRSQSYIAKHLMGAATWRLDDVEAIAPLFGYPNVLSFMAAALC